MIAFVCMLFFQSDAIEQPEEQTPPEILFLAGIFLVTTVLAVCIWLLWSQISFFSKAIEVEGKVVGVLGAKNKGVVTADIPQLGLFKTGNFETSGRILVVEYETEDAIYQDKTRKAYSDLEIGDTITVHYNPDSPEHCAIDKVYEVNPRLIYAMVIGLGLVDALLLFGLFMV